MKRNFYDILNPQGTKCTILLYGYIGRWDDVTAQEVTQAIIEAAAQYQDIDIRINSMGGEVYEGIAIFNTLRLCTSNVTIYVDGIAASAASFIATCGKPVYMGKYSELMLHEASGGCYGNKHELTKCITELTNLDDQLCKIYADKCGKTPEEIQAQFFDGEDHWLTAQQALDMGLIDGIYDMDEVDGTPKQKYTTIYNRLEHQPQTDKTMFYDQLAKKDKRFADCKSDEEVLQVINSLGATATDVAGKDAEIERLKKENKVFNDAKEAEVIAEKKTLLDAAEKDGRITAETRKVYQSILDKDLENGKQALAQLRKTRKVVDEIHQDGGNSKKSVFEARKKQIADKFYNR